MPFIVVAAVFAFPATFTPPDSMTVFSWAILVMGVDVSHVYSTLYRTYFDGETRQNHAALLYLLPFAVLVASMLLYAAGALVFWRVMAYLAVFHFARQQYGFMRVYSRNEQQSTATRRIDALAIYTATFYPILDWHLVGQKSFNWFMKGDFYYLSLEGARAWARAIFLVVIGTYCAKELRLLWNSIAAKNPTRFIFNLPRNLVIAGTFLSWYVGIVHFNSDLAFTAINVMSHGIPYMALVWIWGNKRNAQTSRVGVGLNLPLPVVQRHIFRARYVALFIGLLLTLAYIEEGFWNVWVWHENEHAGLFTLFHDYLGDLETGSPWLGLVVPLLSVPQVTHYVIDGFIWKVRDDRYGWRKVVLD
ncbi:MAG: hypothetical protein ACOY5B_04560 [Spirochaetota bacterium]